MAYITSYANLWKESEKFPAFQILPECNLNTGILLKKMNDHTRQQTLVYLSLVIIGMLLLAASLPTLQFQPGLPIPGAESNETSSTGTAGSNPSADEFHWVLQLSLALGFTALVIVLVVSLVKKANYKKIIPVAAGLLILLCLFLLVDQIQFSTPQYSSAPVQGIATQPSVTYEIAPIGQPPAELFQVVMVILIIGAAVLIFWLLYQVLRRQKREDRVASEAGAALKAIESGVDLRNVIIRSYMQMLSIAEEEQGIVRVDSATPREFERVMTARGIPQVPLHQLTGLFEKVRYGSKPTDLQDEQSAIECLSAIRSSANPSQRISR